MPTKLTYDQVYKSFNEKGFEFFQARIVKLILRKVLYFCILLPIISKSLT